MKPSGPLILLVGVCTVARAGSDAAVQFKQLQEQHKKAVAEAVEPIDRRYQASLE